MSTATVRRGVLEYADLLALHASGLNWYVRSSSPGVQTTLCRSLQDDSRVLFVNNRGDAAKEAELTVQSVALPPKEGNRQLQEIGGTRRIRSDGGGRFHVPVPGNGVTVWRLT